MAEEAADKVDRQYKRGLMTDDERLREIESIWNKCRDDLQRDIEERLKGQNAVYMMADSGAKGNMNQISQMAGMRGLVLDPQGKIVEIPIKSNFREGLTVLEYFISTHGARKGLADTALRTADSGYLTRRLVDVAQDVIINIQDCGTHHGLLIEWTDGEGKAITPEDFRGKIIGRILASPVYDPNTGELIADTGTELADLIEQEDGSNRDLVAEVIATGEKVHVRSVLTCEAVHGVCRLCYGRNLATGNMVELGEAVGIVAAQSIGEPGTQLTMRTFHSGGVARADITTGLPRVEELFEARMPKMPALLAEREGVVTIEQAEDGRKLIISSTEQDSHAHVLEDRLAAGVDRWPGGCEGKDRDCGRTGWVEEVLADRRHLLPRRPHGLHSQRA